MIRVRVEFDEDDYSIDETEVLTEFLKVSAEDLAKAKYEPSRLTDLYNKVNGMDLRYTYAQFALGLGGFITGCLATGRVSLAAVIAGAAGALLPLIPKKMQENTLRQEIAADIKTRTAAAPVPAP